MRWFLREEERCRLAVGSVEVVSCFWYLFDARGATRRSSWNPLVQRRRQARMSLMAAKAATIRAEGRRPVRSIADAQHSRAGPGQVKGVRTVTPDGPFSFALFNGGVNQFLLCSSSDKSWRL